MALSTGTSGSNDFEIADDTRLIFPNSDWAIGGWINFNASPTTSWYLCNYNNWGSDDSLNLFVDSDGHLYTRIDDGDGHDTNNVTIQNSFAAVGTWKHAYLQRVGDSLQGFVNGSTVHESTSQFSAFTSSIAPGLPMIFGSRVGASQFMYGQWAEWAKWDRSHTAADVAAMAKGFTPGFFPADRRWYLPLVRDLIEVDAGLDVSYDGTITMVGGPALIYPSAAGVVPVASVGGGPTGDLPYIGGTQIADVKIGSTDVAAIYKGATPIWQR